MSEIVARGFDRVIVTATTRVTGLAVRRAVASAITIARVSGAHERDGLYDAAGAVAWLSGREAVMRVEVFRG